MVAEVAVASGAAAIVTHNVRDFDAVTGSAFGCSRRLNFSCSFPGGRAMATLSLRLPESIHRQLVQLAKAEGVSPNQLISSAAAEKLAALMTEEYRATSCQGGGVARIGGAAFAALQRSAE